MSGPASAGRTAPDAAGDETAHAAAAEPLLAPRGGPAPLLTTPAEVDQYAALLRGGTGPVAVDTERASGYRYSGRAYLIQLRRAGAGTALIDPVASGPSQALADALGPLEWVLHSADQDLPCLDEFGLRPAALFDTELAGRLLGFRRVNLASMVSGELGFQLAKGHGAADWSRRPLPAEWLDYAALDVELLIELRDALAGKLTESGKRGWADEEFEHIRTAPPSPPDPERWRRTSGLHRIRSRRGLAAVRSLWHARDSLARSLDQAPGRVLPDSAITDAARTDPSTPDELHTLKIFGGPRQRRRTRLWLTALAEARALGDADLPPKHIDGAMPAHTRWRKIAPEAAERLTAARTALGAVSEQVDIPGENLLAPRLLKRLCWAGIPAHEAGQRYIERFLRDGGARRWQCALTAGPLAGALTGPRRPPPDTP